LKFKQYDRLAELKESKMVSRHLYMQWRYG